jgi:hypothetical protein
MAQTSWPFENVDTTETQFSQFFRNLGAGVQGSPAGNELRVTAGTGLAVNVAAGQAMVRGHYYLSSDTEALSLATADGINPRIDTVVLRLNPTTNNILLAVVTGTPDGNPAPPTLTQTDAAIFEYPLANVLVPASAGVPSTITDRRGFLGSRFGLWSTAGRPSAPVLGTAGFNTTLNIPEFYDGSKWVGLISTESPQSGNAIINGAFEINQRNFVSGTADRTFGFDRWYLGRGGDGTSTYSAQAFSPGTTPDGYESANFARIVTTGQTGVDVFTLLQQAVEDVRTFAGQTVTLSFYAKAGSGTPSIFCELSQGFGSGGSPSSSVIVPGGKITLSTSWQKFSVTISVPSISGKTIGTNANSSALITNFWISAGSNFNARTDTLGIQSNTFDIWGVQLEAGTVATPFRRNANSLQGELAACERYFQLVDGASFQAVSGTLVIGHQNFRTPMRAAPSVSLTAAVQITDGAADYTQSSLSVSIIASRATSTGAQISCDSFSGLTLFRPYVSTVLWGKIQLSAEL